MKTEHKKPGEISALPTVPRLIPDRPRPGNGAGITGANRSLPNDNHNGNGDHRQNHQKGQHEALAAEQLFQQSRFPEALARFQNASSFWPDNHEIHFRIALCAWRSQQGHLVEPHLLAAVSLNPKFATAHQLLGQWYILAGKPEHAKKHSSIALELDPSPGQTLSHAFVVFAKGDAQGAWRLLEPLLNRPELAESATMLYAQLAARIGREKEAAQWVLDHLRSHPSPTQERAQLHFVTSKLLDRLGRYDEAFEHARLARELVHRPFDPAAHAEGIDRRIYNYSGENLRFLPRSALDSRRPVFILGMPRSGTSLVEQILSCHPDVFAAGELDELSRAVSALGYGAPSLDSVNRAAGQYLSAINSLNATARYVTDKMPTNYLELGLIQLLFPQCRVIHCMRDPLDTCLSCYMTEILMGGGFCRDLPTLAGYYRQYQRLMAHWKQVLTIPVLEVRYEDVVSDLEGQTRRLLEFLDLSWEPRCLEFHENRRLVATASREQVRRPLYASSVGRWKHYEKHIGELISGLGLRI